MYKIVTKRLYLHPAFSCLLKVLQYEATFLFDIEKRKTCAYGKRNSTLLQE